MFGSSTMTRAVRPLTLRAIDLVIDWLSYVCKALASDSLGAFAGCMTVAISRHNECYRILAALSLLARSIRRSQLRRCDRAASAVQHEQVDSGARSRRVHQLERVIH